MKYTYTVEVVVDAPEDKKIVKYQFGAKFTSLFRAFWYIRKLRKAGPFKIKLLCQKVQEDQEG